MIYQFYTITVLDTFGYSEISHVFNSTLDPLPIEILIDSIVYDYDKMTIDWSKTSDSDIKEIKLLKSNSQINNKDTVIEL